MKNKKLEKKLNNLYILKHLIILKSHYPYKKKPVDRIQQKKLKNIMKNAYKIPLYRKKFEEVGLEPKDFNVPDDLEKFPSLSKEELREWMEEEAKNNPEKYKYYAVTKTSGTTGIPISVFWSPSELAENSANWIRILELQGYNSFFDSCMGIRAGYRISPKGDSFVQKFKILRRKLFDYLLTGEELVNKMNEVKPDLLYGHKSKLVQMAMYIEKNNIEYHKPKYYIPTSEQIDKSSVDLLKRVFGDGIFAMYGSEEQGTSAFTLQGELNKYCISSDTHIINLLDENGRLSNQGRMYVTSLIQYEFPIINYDIGDSAEIIEEEGIKYICNIEGRVDDVFIFEDGTRVARQPFYVALVKRSEIVQARFIQEDLYNIKVEAALKKEYQNDKDKIMEAFIKDIYDNLRHPEVHIKYETFDILPVDKNGKIRMLKSYVKQ